MQHKFDAVNKFLIDQSKLKVIIPADYQFYFKESEGKFKAYEEEINKVMNKNVYSNKLNFNLVKGYYEYNINLDIKSFRGIQTNLKTKTFREILIGFKRETNLGKGLAIRQWKKAFGDTKRYEEFITELDKSVRMLRKKYDTRVKFGTLDNTLNNKDVLQLWGANMKNYDCFADAENSFIIRGRGQAGYLGKHSVSTFGIVTTPVAGIPTLEDMGPRLYNRNTSKLNTKPMGASAMVASSPAVIEDPFKPCEKTKDKPLANRKPKDFLKNLLEGNRASIDIALSDLSNGTKTKHWIWAIFPQPLNVYDTLPNYPTDNSIIYGFNSYEEVEAFLLTNELVINYIICLDLFIESNGN